MNTTQNTCIHLSTNRWEMLVPNTPLHAPHCQNPRYWPTPPRLMSIADSRSIPTPTILRIMIRRTSLNGILGNLWHERSRLPTSYILQMQVWQMISQAHCVKCPHYSHHNQGRPPLVMVVAWASIHMHILLSVSRLWIISSHLQEIAVQPNEKVAR